MLALPRGRILGEVMPLLARAGIVPGGGFDEKDERALQFPTNIENFSIIRVRSFDVATFVAFGAAHLGIAGNDVLMEFDYPEIYAPLDLGVGKCRMAVAATGGIAGGREAGTLEPCAGRHQVPVDHQAAFRGT